MTARGYDRMLDETDRLRTFRRLVQSATLAAGLTVAGLTGVLAQDATPAAMSGTPGAMSGECAPAATPLAGAMASPAASPAGETAEGTAADEELSAAVIAAAENYAVCFNAGDFEAALSLITPAYLIDVFGTDDAATIAAALSGTELPRTTILALDNVMTYPDGRVSVDAQYQTGDHQYVNSRMFFVQEGDAFYLDDEEFLPAEAEGDAAIIPYAITDDTSPVAFTGATSSVEMPVLILYGQNDSESRHAVTLVRLPEGAAGTPVAELSSDALMAAEFIGAVQIEPGERTELVLLNLPPGDYLLVDPMVPGSAAPLTITERES